MPRSVKRPFETRETLLNVAERLFAEKGFEATSVRDIASKARANLAAVHYHFGSKLALIRSVFERRLSPLNQERLRLLDRAEAEGATLESILDAFLSPSVRFLRDNPHFSLLAGRLHSEPNKKIFSAFLGQFEQVIVRFQAALTRALPALPVSEIFWRMHFVIGAMINVWCGYQALEKISSGACDIHDVDGITRRLVEFSVAGLKGKESA